MARKTKNASTAPLPQAAKAPTPSTAKPAPPSSPDRDASALLKLKSLKNQQ